MYLISTYVHSYICHLKSYKRIPTTYVIGLHKLCDQKQWDRTKLRIAQVLVGVLLTLDVRLLPWSHLITMTSYLCYFVIHITRHNYVTHI